MSRRGVCAVALLLACCAGCGIALDTINSDLLVGLGLDPFVINPPSGRIVVTLNNTTDVAATFFVGFSRANGATVTDEGFSAEVEADSIQSFVLDCPIALLRPGQQGLADTNAAVAIALPDGMLAEVEFFGDALTAADLFCGDVIEVRLNQFGGGTAAENFSVVVARLP